MMPLAAIDWHAFFFLLFALVACGFGIAVVATANVVRMAFYLTLCLGATAGLFFLAGAQFVGAMQFMIYVGGTLVLLIFGVMLTAQANFISMKTAAGEWIAGGVLGAALLLLLVRAGLSVEDWRTPRENRHLIAAADIEHTGAIGLALAGVRPDKLEVATPLPNSYSGYLLPFVIVSMHLLVVLVGAGYLARTKRRNPAARAAHGGPVAAARAQPKHSFFVTAGIVSGLVLNVIFAVLAFTFPEWSARLAEGTGPIADEMRTVRELTPAWLPLALTALFALNVLALVVTWQWQRWGVIVLLLVPLFMFALIAATPLGPARAVGLPVVMIVPALALLFLLRRGGRNSAWARME